MDYHAQYIAGRLKGFWQPVADHFPAEMMSFEVYGCLCTGIKEQGIPAEYWQYFDCSKGDPIEAPVFLD